MSNLSSAVCPLIQLRASPRIRAKTTAKSLTIKSQQKQQQPNLSVLRFTFGKQGFLDSMSLTCPDGSAMAPLLSMALNSMVCKISQGAGAVDQITLPQEARQIFVMSQNISASLKEDLAWATYVLLRNTNTIAVMISIQDDLCVRGYWNTPDDLSKEQLLNWFQKQVEKLGLTDLKDTLYFPQASESGLWEMLPKGTCSLLVEPVLQAKEEKQTIEGFVLLASSMSYAYSDKDRAWITAVANKF
ncbi:hypothetical protein Tsubulata_025914 [Turnera subulata]|uniref:Protein COFACTOR ASSEMBLY OF COMPLEX C SUBUNIT B CCB2, chloroplastic n=1 Tax=Turnera subulata TaxID=218843 RepID=A0A9Q0FRB6_9ROSI|nr:hypothetical protein Tsubulata_025914 [Turnera subulata]